MNIFHILKVAVGGLAAYELLRLVKQGTKEVIRPPGAGEEDEFLALCTRCGKCSQVCPYNSIKIGRADHGLGVGTPYIDVRENPCFLCEDLPCIKACPTEALSSSVTNIRDVTMGVAKIDQEHCIAYKGMRCEVCYRECPLIDEAIKLDLHVKPDDEIHTIFGPVINEEICVGCGICVHKCVIEDPIPIQIVPKKAGGLV